MARVLWVSRETPDRHGSGGQRRQYHQIRALHALGHDLTVLAPRSAQDDTTIRQICHVRRPRIYIRGRRNYPALALMYRLISLADWDAIVVVHDDSASLLPPRTRLRAPVLLDMHNVMSAWHLRTGKEEEFRIARDREARALRNVDAVSTCSVVECERLVAVHPSVAGRTFPALLGVDPEEWPDVEFDRAQQLVALFGTWNWDPNAAGLDWFCREVWPPLHAALPRARVLVAGSGVGTTLPAGVEFVGRVSDLAAFAARATVVAVPVVDGVGASVKFAEALASGAHVVATPDGANGFAHSPAFVSSDPGHWVQWISDRLLSRESEPAPAPGRDFALRELTWARAAEPIDEWLRLVSVSPS